MVRALRPGEDMATTFQDDPTSPGATQMAGQLLDRATASHLRAGLFLVLVALLAFLPGFFSIPPTDRDEGRFVQASKQMLETGDYIDIRYQDEVRYKKPVGIYWLQVAAVRAGEAIGVPEARSTIWLYRIPSLLGAIGAVLLTYWTALAFVGRRYACLAGLMMAASILLGVEARIAKTDAMLLLTVIAAHGALAHAYLGEHRREGGLRGRGWALPAVFWTALAAGFLLKGPLILLFAGLTIAALTIADRSWRWLRELRPVLGVIWFLALAMPWFVTILGHAGQTFIAESVGKDMLSKVFSSQESHGAPPGYYLLLFWFTFWPAAPLAALSAPAIWAMRREPPVRFLLAWIVPAWLVFEIVVTKLPHYVLPLYPAVAILIAIALQRETLSGIRRLRWVTIGWPLVAILLPIAFLVLLFVLQREAGVTAWPLAAGAVALGFFAWRNYARQVAAHSLLLAVGAAVLVYSVVFGTAIPALRTVFISPALTHAVQAYAAGCQRPSIASAGYHEPSLVFLAGTDVLLTTGEGAADLLAQGPCRFALVEARKQRGFDTRARELGVAYTAGPEVRGFNLNGGRRIAITVYRSGGPP
jgi:4-amino-4-deoxy-L-arabinose transferase-like glycosyltransferase